MKNFLLLVLLIALPAATYAGKKKYTRFTISDSLEVVQISEHVYAHVSTQTTATFGTFTCNGLIYIISNEAIIMDTPPNEALSEQLLAWMNKTFASTEIKAVIVTHFHDDCLGGLSIFHKAGIPSYSYQLTPKLAAAKGSTVPQHTFDSSLTLYANNEPVISHYPGEAHTRDNIVTWLPKERILFGGCMIKAIGAGKGNLADANTDEWANTVKAVKRRFRNPKIVVPGHGAWGNKKLLNYTIQMFRT
jgi:metallo-beta-lactamase class B